jgi:hypothetical protein
MMKIVIGYSLLVPFSLALDKWVLAKVLCPDNEQRITGNE